MHLEGKKSSRLETCFKDNTFLNLHTTALNNRQDVSRSAGQIATAKLRIAQKKCLMSYWFPRKSLFRKIDYVGYNEVRNYFRAITLLISVNFKM